MVKFKAEGGPLAVAFQQVVVIRYAEIALKGRNRSMFVGQLERNLKEAIASFCFWSKAFAGMN